MIKRIKLWGPVVFWCGLIFYFSHQPHLRIVEAWWDLIVRKIAHMVEYGILARLFSRALTGSAPAWTSRKVWQTAFVLTVLYAVSDEWHQSFIPGRVGSVVDVGIDSLGAALAFAGEIRKNPGRPVAA